MGVGPGLQVGVVPGGLELLQRLAPFLPRQQHLPQVEAEPTVVRVALDAAAQVLHQEIGAFPVERRDLATDLVRPSQVGLRILPPALHGGVIAGLENRGSGLLDLLRVAIGARRCLLQDALGIVVALGLHVVPSQVAEHAPRRGGRQLALGARDQRLDAVRSDRRGRRRRGRGRDRRLGGCLRGGCLGGTTRPLTGGHSPLGLRQALLYVLVFGPPPGKPTEGLHGTVEKVGPQAVLAESAPAGRIGRVQAHGEFQGILCHLSQPGSLGTTGQEEQRPARRGIDPQQ